MVKKKAKNLRWHPGNESDELVYAVCDRYFSQLGITTNKSDVHKEGEERQRGAAASVAEWVQAEYNRPDITREKIYPLFWEAFCRGFLLLQPPWEKSLMGNLKEHFQLESYRGEIIVTNVQGTSAAQHVTSTAADLIVKLIEKIGRERRARFPNDPDAQSVHLGMGAGFAAMLVAKRVAQKFLSGEEMPPLVLHAISSGGFTPQEPHKAPTVYFTYFDPGVTNIKTVALFSETVVNSDDYETIKKNPGVRHCFERKHEIDIIVTSLADAKHEHGLLRHYLSHLSEQKYLDANIIEKMHRDGWVGDVQFRPYTAEGSAPDICPIRAVTLFEIDEMVNLVKENRDKYVVLIAGPCGECGASKVNALRPLLANENLRLWTHLVTDSKTARELLETP